MCYMLLTDQVGVRELRQNLSVYLARVAAGETLEVTDRGQAVAILAPLTRDGSRLSQLKREGRLVAATGDVLTVRRRKARAARWASRELQRDRADRAL